jgi:hypothetical protein
MRDFKKARQNNLSTDSCGEPEIEPVVNPDSGRSMSAGVVSEPAQREEPQLYSFAPHPAAETELPNARRTGFPPTQTFVTCDSIFITRVQISLSS